MTSAEKVAQLRALLCDTLLPLINNDYIFLDIPYYSCLLYTSFVGHWGTGYFADCLQPEAIQIPA